MRDSYLVTHKTKHPHKLISKFRKQLTQNPPSKLPPISPLKLGIQNEKTLMFQIQNLDASLNNKNYRYFCGLLFEVITFQSLDKVAESLRDALKHASLIMQDGFSVWSRPTNQLKTETSNNSRVEKHDHRLSRKMETFNQKMVNLSLKNVYDYDLKKYFLIMNKNRQKWSMYKRNTQLQHSSLSPGQRSTNESILNHSPVKQKKKSISKQLEIINQQAIRDHIGKSGGKSKVKRINTQQSTTKNSQLTENTKFSLQNKYKSYTEETLNPDDPNHNTEKQLSKYELKGMLNKIMHEKLIVIWVPPASYPQFNGLLSYALPKKGSVCRIKRYFFYRRSLTHRFFKGIMEEISAKQDLFVEGLQMVISKEQFSKVYEPVGWRMKSMESINKLKIKLDRNTN